MNLSRDLQRLEQMLQDAGALWEHDGNSARPYALLTSGKISNFYFNGSKAIEKPQLLIQIVEYVLRQADFQIGISVVLGPAVGAIPLVYEVASQMAALAWFAEKNEDGSMEIKRFETRVALGYGLLAEDVITTGGSLLKTLEAQSLHSPQIELKGVVCIVNRSGNEYLGGTGLKIYSLLTKDARVWERGENPFTANGQELLEPVRPKQNWTALTKVY